MSDVLWLVAARSGSRGILNKNIRPLGGVPLMAYRIKAARQLAPSEQVWVSTDSPRYARIARRYGATVPFLRPRKLATARAKSIDVVLHAMDFAEARGLRFKAIGLLEPTSPFVSAESMLQATRSLLRDQAADAIVAVRQARPSSFFVQPIGTYLSELARRISERGLLRRQDERLEVTPSGGFYIARWDRMRVKRSFYTPFTRPYLLSGPAALEIDEPEDWDLAQVYARRERAGRGA